MSDMFRINKAYENKCKEIKDSHARNSRAISVWILVWSANCVALVCLVVIGILLYLQDKDLETKPKSTPNTAISTKAIKHIDVLSNENSSPPEVMVTESVVLCKTLNRKINMTYRWNSGKATSIILTPEDTVEKIIRLLNDLPK